MSVTSWAGDDLSCTIPIHPDLEGFTMQGTILRVTWFDGTIEDITGTAVDNLDAEQLGNGGIIHLVHQEHPYYGCYLRTSAMRSFELIPGNA